MTHTLSMEQAAVLERTGRFVLRACPGSGKTFLVGRRVAYRIAEWSERHAGLAVLSFTNVACDEIRNTVHAAACSQAFVYPHFIGTLDSFINQFIFLPFGCSVMGCKGRPRVVGAGGSPLPTTGIWGWGKGNSDCQKNRCTLAHFSWDPSDAFVDIRPNKIKCTRNYEVCKRLKDRFRHSGYATQTDAAYWAVRALRLAPAIARALVQRFPEIIVDEAQDTSELQMAILDLLVDAGLKHLLLVGDPDQAIYEWREARPELLERKTIAAGWEHPSLLTESHRNPQLLCNAVAQFSTLASPVRGRDTADQPELWFYKKAEMSELPARFERSCDEQRIAATSDTCSVLARGRVGIRRLAGFPDEVDPWKDGDPITRALAEVAIERDRGDRKTARRHLESLLVRAFCSHDHDHGLARVLQISHPDVGVLLFSVLSVLPSSTEAVASWVQEANATVEGILKEIAPNRVSEWPGLSVKAFTMVGRARSIEFRNRPLVSFFTGTHVVGRVRVETIHAAKGKTYEAVLLVLDNHSKECTPKRLLEQHPPDRRTAYVAMTRARRYLAVAVPDDTKAERLAPFDQFKRVIETS